MATKKISNLNRIPNKGLHRTAHKLPKLRGLTTINIVAASNYCACAPSGEA